MVINDTHQLYYTCNIIIIIIMDHAYIDDNKRYLTTETDTSCGNKKNKVLLKYTQ